MGLCALSFMYKKKNLENNNEKKDVDEDLLLIIQPGEVNDCTWYYYVELYICLGVRY